MNFSDELTMRKNQRWKCCLVIQRVNLESGPSGIDFILIINNFNQSLLYRDFVIVLNEYVTRNACL